VRFLGLTDRSPGRAADGSPDRARDDRASDGAGGGLLFDGVTAGGQGQAPGHQGGYD
jgi:hypothetical protein